MAASETPVSPDQLHPSLVGKQSRVVYDKITDLEGAHPEVPTAVKVRTYKVEFVYSQTDQTHIYYEIFQLLDKEHQVLQEIAKFSWNEMGPFNHLPAGCPPPIISAPPKPDPCQMGYAIGEVISTVIANVVVPQLMVDDPDNPFAEELLFKEVKKIEDEMNLNGTQADELNERQVKFLEDYRKLVLEFADKKINCFSEHIIPVKKLDIEFICTDQGAHKTIEDALAAAMLDGITCHHVNCNAIQDALDQGSMKEHSSVRQTFLGDGDVLNAPWVELAEGIVSNSPNVLGEDEDEVPSVVDNLGNVRVPDTNTDYVLINVHALVTGNSPFVRTVNGRVVLSDTCQDDAGARVVLSKLGNKLGLSFADDSSKMVRVGSTSNYYLGTFRNNQQEKYEQVLHTTGASVYIIRSAASSNKMMSMQRGLSTSSFSTFDKHGMFVFRSGCPSLEELNNVRESLALRMRMRMKSAA